jgi:putative ABC transport system permease protein
LSLEIVGVVKNNNFYSLQGETGAEYFLIGRDKRLSRFLFVRFEESYAKSIREDIASTFEAVVGEPLLYAMFGEQAPGFGLTRDRNLGRLLATLAVLAFLISCFGLVGLSALTLERREKEIGIRKVMGASDKSILRLFIWQFIKPVLLANIFAWVCAFMAISAWLSGFARRIDSAVLYPIFPAAGMLSLAIVCLTIWLVITKFAGSHPVKSLRYE